MCHDGSVHRPPDPADELPHEWDDACLDPDEGKPREACGVFGVYAPGMPVPHLAYLGIYALQHRGQESAGIATSDGDHLTVVKDMGLVSNVFDDRTLAALDGDLAIGHTRYSTTGSSMWKNSQPIYRDVVDSQFALAHNGNLVNTAELAEDAGMLPGTVSSDTEAMAEQIALACERLAPGESLLEQALLEVLPSFDGAFSLTLLDTRHLIGVRDPHGFRPLCLGKLDSGWVLASETPALDVVGAHFVRELDPGEMVVIDADGVRSLRPFDDDDRPKLCLFEFVYFARPSSTVAATCNVRRVCAWASTRGAGPVEADMVMGVPESPARRRVARHSGRRSDTAW
jgi:amidophosphoribosyltransferase